MSRNVLRLLTLGGSALLLATCNFPNDESQSVFVTIGAPQPVLLRGQEMNVVAQAWRRLEGGDSVEIKNVDFLWFSGDNSRATVVKGDYGATVTGVNSGLVQIVAVPAGYSEGADEGYLDLRVANELEVDSVRPSPVRYGQQLTLRGIGLQNIFLASLGGAALIADTFSFYHDPATGLDSMRFWVPAPARSDRLFVLGPGLFGLRPDTTRVIPVDLYEPNDTAFAAISLDGPPQFPTSPSTQFFNPALFFEPIPRDSFQREDWYRFSRTSLGSAVTLSLERPSFDTSFVFVSDSLYYDGAAGGFFVGDSAWMIGPGFLACHGLFYFYLEAETRSTLVALARLPSDRLHLLSFYQRTGPYKVAALNGYVRLDPRFAQDRFEENDICNFADENFANTPSLRIILNPAGPGFSDVLTIDNPHELDWYRFRVPSLTTGAFDSLNVTVATGARPLSTADSIDDVDFYVVKVPAPGAFFLDEVMFSVAVGSDDTVTARLQEGDYYLLAADYLGVPTRYAVCIAAAPAVCALPPAPPGGGVARAAAPAGSALRHKPTRPPNAARAAAALGLPPRLLRPRFR